MVYPQYRRQERDHDPVHFRDTLAPLPSLGEGLGLAASMSELGHTLTTTMRFAALTTSYASPTVGCGERSEPHQPRALEQTRTR